MRSRKQRRQSKVRLDATELKAIMNALSERDETAEPCRDSRGEIEADPELRDTENVPLRRIDSATTSSAKCGPTFPTPGSMKPSAITRMARSAK